MVKARAQPADPVAGQAAGQLPSSAAPAPRPRSKSSSKQHALRSDGCRRQIASMLFLPGQKALGVCEMPMRNQRSKVFRLWISLILSWRCYLGVLALCQVLWLVLMALYIGYCTLFSCFPAEFHVQFVAFSNSLSCPCFLRRVLPGSPGPG